MPEKKSRFVIVCQQLLAFGTVLALAASAATVVDLEIVAPTPAEDGAGRRTAGSLVASEPVEPDVSEIPVHGVEAAGLDALTGSTRARENAKERLAALSAPEAVTGYATVGVTWKHGVQLGETEIHVSVRTLEDGVWSSWDELVYDADHGPDPGTVEARRARPGTDPIVVGDVDQVQVKAVTASGEAPADLELSVVDPGRTVHSRIEQPAIDTAELGTSDTVRLSAGETTADSTGTTGAAQLAATPAYVTAKPKIYSRAQWGADERMRDRSSLSYYEVHAAFVHHTVNANNYTRDQVPSLIRGIYAYHTQSKGWSDIGYNFVVDKFGRIWEGRYGGVERPVVGAHTLGYNEYSFAMSALGNFENAKPSSAMLDAYGRLFAWKLSLHGVKVSSTSQRLGKSTFRAINGHRDAGQTACPGSYLYARLPGIRTRAAGYQKPFASRSRSADVAGSAWPDLVVRDKVSKHLVTVRTGGQVNFKRAHVAGRGWGGMDLLTSARDLTGDGRPDMVGRKGSTKVTGVYPGTAEGGFGPPVLSTDRFAGADQIAGSLDLTGDRNNDLVARIESTKNLYLYPGRGNGGFGKRRLLADSWGAYELTAGIGDLDRDGHNDLIARDGGRLYLVRGTGTGLGARVQLPHWWAGFDLITGIGDVTNDYKPDIIARVRQSKLTYVFPGDGHGGLGHRFGPFAQFKGATFLAAAGQLAGNKRKDIVARDSSGRLVAFANNGRRNLERVVDSGQALVGSNLVLNVGDWNGDGHGDVMTRVAQSGYLHLRAGDGKGGFAAPVVAGKGWNGLGLVAAVGDITGDGNPDLMGQPDGAAMRIYPGDGSSGFKASYRAHSSIGGNRQVGVGLWNGDGSPDTVVRRSDGSLSLFPGNGPGGLMNPTRVGTNAQQYDWLLAVGDADGNGRPDLIGREAGTGVIWLLPGSRSGVGPRRFVADGFDTYDLNG